MSIDAIIFDLDGTLLDTLEDLAQATNQALAEAGLAARPVEDFRLLVGAGAKNLVTRAAANASGISTDEVSPALVEQLLKSFSQAYASGWDITTKAYEGIEDMLDSLQNAGIKLGILSNKPDDFTQVIAKKFFPHDTFVIVAGKKSGWPIKPDPALALELCRLMGVDPDKTALVGDSGSDMETAVRAGMLPIGVLWGFRSAEELAANGAAWLADDPTSLTAFILKEGVTGEI